MVSHDLYIFLPFFECCILIGAEVVGERGGGISVPGSGPIFLSTLSCSANNDDILGCSRVDLIGITRCSHSQDVYIRCQGKWTMAQFLMN